MPLYAVHTEGTKTVYGTLVDLEQAGFTKHDAKKFDDFVEAEHYAENGEGPSQDADGDFWVVSGGGECGIFCTREDCDEFAKQLSPKAVDIQYFIRRIDAEFFAACAIDTLGDTQMNDVGAISVDTLRPDVDRSGSSPEVFSEGEDSSATTVEPISQPQDKSPAEEVLDERQQTALELAHAGHSFFLTGVAGTGKSFVLKRIVKELREKGLKVNVTASTGMAALAVGGSTIHRFSGVGNGMKTKNQLHRTAGERFQIVQNWRQCQVLVIDEISMIDSFLFDKIEDLARFCRKEISRPFGGIQVIVCGDFFQLPPVAASDAKAKKSGEKYFAFESEAWARTIECELELTHVHRQSSRHFVNLLNEVRQGEMSDKTIQTLKSLVAESRSFNFDSARPRTKLYAYRNEVQRINDQCLRRLKCPAVSYIAKDGWEDDEGRQLLFSTNMPCGRNISLKVGATVICVKNLDTEGGIVNGSIGEIVAFGKEYSKLELPVGKTSTQVIQQPRIFEEVEALARDLSEANSKKEVSETKPGSESEVAETLKVSIPKGAYDTRQHKMEEVIGAKPGNDIEMIEKLKTSTAQISNKDLPIRSDGTCENSPDCQAIPSASFEGAQKKLELVQESTFKVSECEYKETIYPWVKFSSGTRLIKPTEFPVDNAHGEQVAKRTQIPLVLGWALTIHRAQGMSIDQLETALGKSFDFGMSYVSLSRLRSLDGLRLMSFDANRVRAHRKVKEYAKNHTGDRAIKRAQKLVFEKVSVPKPLRMPPWRDKFQALK